MKWNAQYFRGLALRMKNVVTSTDPFMLQWGRLFFWFLLLLVAWFVKHKHNATDTEDGVILLTMGLVFGVAFLLMLWENTVRTIRNLGLMSVFLGLHLLFTSWAMSGFGWIEPIQEEHYDVIRTLYIVGGIAFTYGAINTFRDWELNRKHILYFILSLLIAAISIAFAFMGV